MNRYVDLDEKVTAEFYDEEHEERFVKETTVEDILSICDSYTVHRMPVLCKDCQKRRTYSICKYFGDYGYCAWGEDKPNG